MEYDKVVSPAWFPYGYLRREDRKDLTGAMVVGSIDGGQTMMDSDCRVFVHSKSEVDELGC